MGTRADFYVGRGTDAEWLGSIAWDGYPEGHPKKLLRADTEAKFRKRVAKLLAERKDATTVAHGWPWPWETSTTTDFAYAFDAGAVHASCFGGPWFDPTVQYDDDEEQQGPRAVFPEMTPPDDPLHERSGLIVIRG